MKLLKEKYKTYEGARKRAGFENGVAVSEYKHGTMRHVYRYSIVAEGDHWRVQREKASDPLAEVKDYIRRKPDAFDPV